MAIGAPEQRVEDQKAIIEVCELWPGGGASSVAKILGHEDVLNLESVGIGQFRRALALHWQEFCANYSHGNVKECWTTFESMYHDAMQAQEPALHLQMLVRNYYSSICPNDVLGSFTQTQQHYTRSKKMWDQIPDILGYHQLKQPTHKNGYIIDAKLGPRYQDFLSDQHGKLPNHYSELPLWLDVTLRNSAIRVVTREIVNGTLQMDGVPQEELIKWVLSKKYEVETDSEIYVWFMEQVTKMLAFNLNRVTEDYRRYQESYDHTPKISAQYIHSTPGMMYIDANQELVHVVYDSLYITNLRLPQLIHPYLRDIIEYADIPMLGDMIHTILKRPKRN